MIKSWKTTLVGILIGVGTVVLQLVQHGTTDAKTLLVAGGVALLGIVSKDHDVSGSN